MSCRTVRALLATVLVAPAIAAAAPVSLSFSGIHVSVAGEFINAVPVPVADRLFSPLFAPASTTSATISYDTAQPDTDADPDTGTYRIGTLGIQIGELALSATRSSNAMQISAFNDVGGTNDQFFAFSSGFDTFSSGVGLPTPVSMSLLLFGDTSMLADDSLPTSALNWRFGNLSFDFVDNDQKLRQVLLTFEPQPNTVPNPPTSLLLLAALAGLWASKRKRPVR